MNLVINDLSGLARAAELHVGGRKLTVKTMNVATSRIGWVKLQPLLTGMMAADDLEKEGIAMSGLAMAGITGRLDEKTFDWFADEFAKLTKAEFKDSEGNECTFENLAMKGAMDAVFAGAFEDMMVWLDGCIKFVYGEQMGKQAGALDARAKLLQKKIAEAADQEKSASRSLKV